MVMQAASDFWVGGSNPGPANMAAAPTDQDSICQPKTLQSGALPFNRGWM